MANPYAKRQIADKATSINATPAQAPSIQNGLRAIEVRRQLMMQSIDAINTLGQGGIALGEKTLKDNAAKEGIQDALNDSILKPKGETPEQQAERNKQYGTSFWSGSARQDAYDKVKAERIGKELPAEYERNYAKRMQDNPDLEPLEQLTPQQRRDDYQSFKTQWFKANKFDGKTFTQDADIQATSTMNQHLGILDKKSEQFKQSEALGNIKVSAAETISGLIKSNELGNLGVPLETAIDNYITDNMGTWVAASGGDAQQARKNIFDHLAVKASGVDNGGIPEENIYKYLQTEDAKKRFGGMEGYDRAMYQIDHATSAYRTTQKKAIMAKSEDEFYGNLNNSGFGSVKEVDDWLKASPLDEEKRFQLRAKAIKFLKIQGDADNLVQAYNAGQNYIINGAKPEEVEQFFSMQVGNEGNFNLNNPNTYRMAALSDWLNRGLQPPKWVRKFGQHTTDNTDAGQKQLMEQLGTYVSLKKTVGPTGMSMMFSDKAVGKLELYSRIINDTTLKPEQVKEALDGYDEAVNIPYFRSTDLDTKFKDELIQKSTIGKDKPLFQSFAKDNSLQPWFTFSDASAPAQEYAQQALAMSYKAFRFGKLNPEEAQARAEADFEANHNWVEWGGNQQSYLPKELGSDVKRVMNFLDYKQQISQLSTKFNMTETEAKEHIMVLPATDYTTSRQYDVLFDGVPTQYRFSADEMIQQDDEVNSYLSEKNKKEINDAAKNRPKEQTQFDRILQLKTYFSK